MSERPTASAGWFVLGVGCLITAVAYAGGEITRWQQQAVVLLLGLIGVAALAEAYLLYPRSRRQTGPAARRDNGLPRLAGASRWLVVVGVVSMLGAIAYLGFVSSTVDESRLSGPVESETPEESRTDIPEESQTDIPEESHSDTPEESRTELDFGDTFSVSRDGTSEVTLGVPTLARCQWFDIGCDDPEIGQRVVQVPIRIENSGSTPVRWSADYFVLAFADGTRTTWLDGVTYDYEPRRTLGAKQVVQPGATYEGVMVLEAPDGRFRVHILADPSTFEPLAAWSLTGPVEPEILEELDFGDTLSVSRDGTSEVTLGVPTLATCQWPDIGCDDPEIGQRVVQVPIRIENSGSTPVRWSANYFVLAFADGTKTTWLDGVTYDYEPRRTLGAKQVVQPGATYEGVMVLEAPTGPFQILVLADPGYFEPLVAWR